MTHRSDKSSEDERMDPGEGTGHLFPSTRESDGLPLHGISVCEVNAREIADHYRAVHRYDRYWTAAADQSARHVERRDRGPDGALHSMPIHRDPAPGH